MTMMDTEDPAPGATIDVFLADDNVIVREGVRTLLERQGDLGWWAWPRTTTGWWRGSMATQPHVLVTDIRMPPTFQREGIEAAREVRQRCPGTGVVILSQYDDPEYAVSLVAEGSAGYGYLLKDHIAEGNQLVDAVRAVATGGTALDPSIVDALVRPVTTHGGLTRPRRPCWAGWPRASPSRPSPLRSGPPPKSVDAQVEALFVKLAQGVSAGTEGAIRRLRLLHQCIVDREEQGESLSRLLPGGLAEKLRRDGRDIGKTEVVEVTVLMSDIRSYSTIAEHADPSQLAGQLNTHRAAMNRAILGQGGTIMQFVGDAVMAVFGAPFSQPDHAERALRAPRPTPTASRPRSTRAWERDGLPPFGLGLGLSTGEAAAALLGTEERLEYTLVGDTVNLSQRLQQLAESGETVVSQATMDALAEPVEATLLPEQLVKGRDTPVRAWRIARQVPVVRSGYPATAPAGVRLTRCAAPWPCGSGRTGRRARPRGMPPEGGDDTRHGGAD